MSIKICRNFYGDPKTGKIAESVFVDELTSDQIMNEKREWTYVKLNKISLHLTLTSKDFSTI